MAKDSTYSNYDPNPGPKQPDKYPVPPGENYQHYGEQTGYVYDPYTDTYYPHAQQQADYYEQSGIKPKKDDPSLTDYILPVAAAGGAYAAAQGFATNPSGFISGISDAITAPFSTGGPAGVTSTQGATAGASTAPATATPAAASAAPFSLGGSAGGQAAAAGGADLASSVPFSFGAGQGAVPAAPTVVEATATPSAAAAAPGSTWLGAGGILPTAAGIAAGAYTGYQQFQGVKNAVQNKPLSLTEQVALALPTFGMSFLVNPAQKFFGSSKGPEQLSRDAVRKNLQEKGLIDKDFNIYNVDGSSFNVGKDGGAMLPGGAYGGQRHYYDVNHEDPAAVALIPAADALAAIVTGGNKKLTSDFTGYFVNAATSSGAPSSNLMSYFQQLGLDHDTAYGMVHQMSQGGGKDGKPLLDQATADAYKNSLDQFFGVGAYAGGAKPQALPVAAPAPSAPKPQPQPVAAPTPAPQPAPVAPTPAPVPAPPKPKQPVSLFNRNR